jgi:hypothetical protein
MGRRLSAKPLGGIKFVDLYNMFLRYLYIFFVKIYLLEIFTWSCGLAATPLY